MAKHRKRGYQESETEDTTMSDDTAPAPVESLPENEELGDRIKAIEDRYGKEFMAVLVDIHDHLFGKTPKKVEKPEDEEDKKEETSDA